jgi:O-antigen ligase
VGAVGAWRRRAVRLDLLVLALLGLAAVAAWQAARLGDAGGGIGLFVPLAVVALALPQLDRPVRDDGTDPAVVVVVAAGVVVAVWTAALVVPALLEPDQRLYLVKAAADLPIGASNFLGALLATTLVAALALPRSRWRTSALVVLGIGLVLTLSRAAWLSIVAVLVLRWLLHRWDRRREATRPAGGRRRLATLVAPLAVVAAMVGIFALTESSGTTRLEQLTSPATESRLEIWRAGADALSDAGLTGYGLYGFPEYARAADAVETHPHNLELAAFGMFGLLGGLLYVGWWVGGLVRTLGGPDRDALGLPLLVLFLHAQVDAWSFHLPFEALAVILVGLAATRSGTPALGVVELSSAGTRAGQSSSRRNLPV